GHTTAGDLQQPTLERAEGRVVFEARHLLGDRDDRLLYGILGLGVVQPRLESEVIDESPVGVEELAPTVLVVPVFQPAQQAAARWNESVFVHALRQLWYPYSEIFGLKPTGRSCLVFDTIYDLRFAIYAPIGLPT